MLFNFSINDLDDDAECGFTEFADGIRSGGVAVTPESCAATQRDLERLTNWAERNLVKFDNRKCKVLHWGKNNSRHQYLLGAEQLESSCAKRDPGVLGNKKPPIHQQYALMMKKANSILGCIGKTIASTPREVILALYLAHLEC